MKLVNNDDNIDHLDDVFFRKLDFRKNFFFFFLIGIHLMQGWTATMTHGVKEKKYKKDYRIQKICLERTYS